MRSRKQYISMIWIYENRCKALNKKIKSWKREVKRIDAKNSKAQAIIAGIKSYFNIDITKPSNKPDCVLARNCYYKFGMDNGLRGYNLVRAIGGKHLQRASTNRLSFTRSFRKNNKNRETYHKFMEYMINNYE